MDGLKVFDVLPVGPTVAVNQQRRAFIGRANIVWIFGRVIIGKGGQIVLGGELDGLRQREEIRVNGQRTRLAQYGLLARLQIKLNN